MSEIFNHADYEVRREASLERALTKMQNELWNAQWGGRAEERRRANGPWLSEAEADKDAKAA